MLYFAQSDNFKTILKALISKIVMKKLALKTILRPLHFVIPFFIVVLGCLILAHILFDFDKTKRILFGVIFILYGSFRIYQDIRKNRDRAL